MGLLVQKSTGSTGEGSLKLKGDSTLSGTLVNVVDSGGNESKLRLSTSQVSVKGDGSAIFNVANSSGQNLIEADTTNGTFVVRQPGGTAGTDEVQISHDGTNTLIEPQSGELKTSAVLNIGQNLHMATSGPLLIGTNHGASVGDESVAIGKGARTLEDTGGTIANNHPRSTVVGFQAGNNTGTGVFGLTAFGYSAARNNTGNRVTANGYLAARDNTGENVTANGYLAALSNTGSQVTASGYSAAGNNTKDDVTAVGYSALRGDGITAANMGARTTGIGSEALRNNTGDDVVGIGYQAGSTNTENNQFILQNKNVNATPLIQGDFATGKVATAGRIFHGNGFTSRTLGANLTLTTTDEEIQLIDAGGSARNVVLPAEADATGLKFWIKNTGGEDLTMQDDASSTIATVSSNESTMVVCDGSSWVTLGVWTITQS